jgi:hypothetical protein
MTSLFPPRESLVSDIPAGVGTGISKSFFYSVMKKDRCAQRGQYPLVRKE